MKVRKVGSLWARRGKGDRGHAYGGGRGAGGKHSAEVRDFLRRRTRCPSRLQDALDASSLPCSFRPCWRPPFLHCPSHLSVRRISHCHVPLLTDISLPCLFRPFGMQSWLYLGNSLQHCEVHLQLRLLLNSAKELQHIKGRAYLSHAVATIVS